MAEAQILVAGVVFLEAAQVSEVVAEDLVASEAAALAVVEPAVAGNWIISN